MYITSRRSTNAANEDARTMRESASTITMHSNSMATVTSTAAMAIVTSTITMAIRTSTRTWSTNTEKGADTSLCFTGFRARCTSAFLRITAKSSVSRYASHR